MFALQVFMTPGIKPIGLDIAKQQTKNVSTLTSTMLPVSKLNHIITII